MIRRTLSTIGCAEFDKSLYAITTDGNINFVKFGIAKDPEQRLTAIQVGCPLDLVLAATLPHTLGLEARVHEFLKSYRARGEWFHASDDVLRAVEIMKGGDAQLFEDYLQEIYYTNQE